MSKKDDFKNFIVKKPNLIDYVKDNKTTWQKLYEIYDIYGENNDIWDKYNIKEEAINNNIDLKNILGLIKNINLDSLEENITSIQKVVALVSEFTKKDDKKEEIKAKESNIDEIYGDNNEDRNTK